MIYFSIYSYIRFHNIFFTSVYNVITHFFSLTTSIFSLTVSIFSLTISILYIPYSIILALYFLARDARSIFFPWQRSISFILSYSLFIPLPEMHNPLFFPWQRFISFLWLRRTVRQSICWSFSKHSCF